MVICFALFAACADITLAAHGAGDRPAVAFWLVMTVVFAVLVVRSIFRPRKE